MKGLLLILIVVSTTFAQRTPLCPDVQSGDFQKTDYSIGNRPVSVDFLKKSDGTYDAYFARLNGDVVRVTSNGTKETVTRLNTVNIGYTGLTSFLFHPDFETNGWVFTLRTLAKPGWTGPKVNGAYIARLSRHNFNPITKQLSSEKVLIDVPQISVKSLGGCGSLCRAEDNEGNYGYFQNAQMRFDSKGNLYANLGADHRSHESYVFTTNSKFITSSGEARASNTKELHGIIRIHPDNSAKGYSIPEGNFREYFEEYFTKLGETSIAQEYSAAANKVAPEVYTKGHRTNWTLKTHPTKDWVMWGEVGVTGAFDEIGIVANPVFAGYPYFHGNNDVSFRYYKHHHGIAEKAGYDKSQNRALNPNSRSDVNRPKNFSPFNNGVINLPPAFNPQITSQRANTLSGMKKLTDYAGITYATNGSVGGSQAVDYNGDWFEVGVDNLTPIQPTVPSNKTRYTSITNGGIYDFDLALNSRSKFPVHFDDYLFIFDWEQQVIDLAKIVEQNGEILVSAVTPVKNIFNINSKGVIDASFAPDGTMFVSRESGTVTHIKYSGNCVHIDTNYVPPTEPASIGGQVSKNGIQITNNALSVEKDGSYVISLYNHKGKLIASENMHLIKEQEYHFQNIFKSISHGLYVIRVTNKNQSAKIKWYKSI